MDAIQLEFDSRIYSVDTLQRAALKFTDACSFDFRLRGDIAEVAIAPLNEAYTLKVDPLVASFRNEVLDQHLRSIIAKETENERNLILAYAFSNTKLIAS